MPVFVNRYVKTTYSCRGCGAVLAVLTDYEIGSPLRVCKKCQTKTFVKDFQEWEIFSEGPRGAWIAQRVVGFPLLGLFAGAGLVFLLYFLIAVCSGVERPGLALAVGIFVAIAIPALGWGRTFRAVSQSKQRMQDPAYRMELIELGFGITPKPQTRSSRPRPIAKVKVKDAINPLSCSADGKLVLVSTNAGKVFSWNLADPARLARIPVPKRPYSDSVLSPDGRLIATRFDDGVAICDRIDGHELCRCAEAHGRPLGIEFAADSWRLLIAGKEIGLWDAQKGTQLQTYAVNKGDGGFGHCHVSPDGTKVCAMTRNLAMIWDLETAALVASGGRPLSSNGVCWMPDSQALLMATKDFAQIFQPYAGKLRAGMQVPGRDVAAPSRDGQWILTGIQEETEYGKVNFFERSTGRWRASLTVGVTPTQLLCLPDGATFLVKPFSDPYVQLWNFPEL